MRRGSPLFPLLLLTVTGCFLAGVAAGSDESHKAEPDAYPNGIHAKGRVELAVLTGLGASHAIWGGVADVRVLALGARIGRVVSQPRGPGFLKGNLEVAAELLPLVVVDSKYKTYGASITILGRHFFMPSSSSWRPYAILGIGFLVTGQDVPDNSTRINFTPQGGIGVTFTTRHQMAFYAEYRLHHISAGRRTPAGNPGINSSYFQFSASLFHW